MRARSLVSAIVLVVVLRPQPFGAGTSEPFVGRPLPDGMNRMTIEFVQAGTKTDVTNERAIFIRAI
jgi:hypothetical protein